MSHAGILHAVTHAMKQAKATDKPFVILVVRPDAHFRVTVERVPKPAHYEPPAPHFDYFEESCELDDSQWRALVAGMRATPKATPDV